MTKGEAKRVAWFKRHVLAHELGTQGFRKRMKFGTRVGKTLCDRVRQKGGAGGRKFKRPPGPNNAGLLMTASEVRERGR